MNYQKSDREYPPKVQAALDKLQAAQAQVADAGEEISSLDGYADQWNSIMELYSTIKKEWHDLANHKPGDCK